MPSLNTNHDFRVRLSTFSAAVPQDVHVNEHYGRKHLTFVFKFISLISITGCLFNILFYVYMYIAYNKPNFRVKYDFDKTYVYVVLMYYTLFVTVIFCKFDGSDHYYARTKLQDLQYRHSNANQCMYNVSPRLFLILKILTIIFINFILNGLIFLFIQINSNTIGNQAIVSVYCNSILNCQYLTLQPVYFWVIARWVYPTITSLVVCSLFTAIYGGYKGNKKYVYNDLSNDQLKIELISRSQTLTVPASDENQSMDSNYNSTNVTNYNEIIVKTHALIYWYFVSYWFVLCLFNAFLMLLSEFKTEKIVKYWERWYYALLLSSGVTKYCLKRIARRIDMLRLMFFKIGNYNYNYNNNSNYDYSSNYISFEWINEMLISLFYWIFYRYFLTFILPNLEFSKFLISAMIHLFSELLHAARMTTQYYNITKNLINMLVNKNRRNNNRLWFIFNDDSTYNEWCIRMSIDIVTRIFVSILTLVLQIIWIFIVGPANYHWDVNDLFDYLYFNLILFTTEIIYFITMCIIFKYYYNINIITPFQMLFQRHETNIVLLWMLAQMLPWVVF